jgi:threonyl-tRNA synthetase
MSDHRELGRAPHPFATPPDVCAGLPLWLPDGAAIRSELERFAAEESQRAGCRRVFTPVLAKRSLYERSGHWAKYADDMFPPMPVGGDELVLRPANCPHHALIYASQQRSYRDLPVRLAELARMFRSELSGVLGGLSRVRQINLDDAHVFCREDQIEDEVVAAVEQMLRVYGVFGIEVGCYRLSRRDSGDGYLGDPALWDRAEEMLRQALRRAGVDYVEAPGEAAFYGPKIDVQVIDPAGREESLSTVQLDFNQPERLDLRYVAADGSAQRPVMIHRGIMSAMDRLVAHLIELYDGAFPTWLAPVQLVVLPVTAGHASAAYGIAEAAHGLRVEVDAEDNSLASRIRRAHDRRSPYIAVVGDQEIRDGSVALRLRDGRRLSMRVPDALAEISQVASDRRLDLGFAEPPAGSHRLKGSRTTEGSGSAASAFCGRIPSLGHETARRWPAVAEVSGRCGGSRGCRARPARRPGRRPAPGPATGCPTPASSGR